MSRLAFHLPRLIALAVAIAAAMSAHWLHSLVPDAPSTPPAQAAVGTHSCGPSAQGFTSYSAERRPRAPGDCAKPRPATRSAPSSTRCDLGPGRRDHHHAPVG
jgi:hypothetical protein